MGKSYDDFLRVMQEGWNSSVRLPDYEVVEKHGGAARGVAAGAGAIVGGVAGGLVGYALSGGTKSKHREIITDIRVPENGIVIQQGTVDGRDLRIPWENIKEIQLIWKYMGTVLLRLTDGSDIRITAPHISSLFSSHSFTDEFIEYVNEHAAGQTEEGW